MTDQLPLLATKAPPIPEGIDLHLGSCEDLLPMEGDLAVADSPWTYDQRFGTSGADDHYGGLPIPKILEHIAELRAPRLALWITFPLVGEWPKALPGWGEPISGGSWHKSMAGDEGHYGQGFHWAGCSELVLIYTRKLADRKLYTDRGVKLRNAHTSPPNQHSRKPVAWMMQWMERWCPPGGKVIEPYAGLGATAEAAYRTGRLYRGAELNEERHGAALSLIAQARR